MVYCFSPPTEYSLGYGTLQGTLPPASKRSDIDNVNIYRPSLSGPEEEEDLYKGHHNYQEIPQGAYPASEHARYDGRYIYDHEAPPRPPLPDETGQLLFTYLIISFFYLRIH